MIRTVFAAIVLAMTLPAQLYAGPATPFSVAANARKPGVHQTASGLQYRVIKPGRGPLPAPTDVALIRYVGKLTDGTTFDASPKPVPLPIDATVAGFAEGLRLMRKGGVYRLWIKPELGYGDKEQRDDSGKVVLPANSILVFDVTVVDFIPRAQYEALKANGGVD